MSHCARLPNHLSGFSNVWGVKSMLILIPSEEEKARGQTLASKSYEDVETA